MDHAEANTDIEFDHNLFDSFSLIWQQFLVRIEQIDYRAEALTKLSVLIQALHTMRCQKPGVTQSMQKSSIDPQLSGQLSGSSKTVHLQQAYMKNAQEP